MNCNPYYYDYIMVSGGICDITSLTRTPTRRVIPQFNLVPATVENFERLLAVFRESANLFTWVPIVYAPLVGIHLTHYSLGDSNVFSYQPITDESVPLNNKIIKQVNRWNGLLTPDYVFTIHHSKGHQGTYRTKYGRLTDGCHPDERTRLLWAQAILKGFTNYIYA